MDWFLYDNGLRHERVKVSNKENELDERFRSGVFIVILSKFWNLV